VFTSKCKDPGAEDFWKNLPVFKHGLSKAAVQERLRMAQWWESKAYLQNPDKGDIIHHKDADWIFDNVVFIDPFSYLLKTPSSRVRVETLMGSQNQRGWMSPSQRLSSTNRPRDVRASKQKSNDDTKWCILFVLWRGKCSLIHIGPDRTREGDGYREVVMADGPTSAGFVEDSAWIEKLCDGPLQQCLAMRGCMTSVVGCRCGWCDGHGNIPPPSPYVWCDKGPAFWGAAVVRSLFKKHFFNKHFFNQKTFFQKTFF
jgi:hypothetical protein